MEIIRKHPVTTFISLVVIMIFVSLIFRERRICDQKFLNLEGRAEFLLEGQKILVDCEVDEDVMGWPSLSLELESGDFRTSYKYLLSEKDTLFFLFAEFPELGRTFERELSQTQKEKIKEKTLICFDEVAQTEFPNQPPSAWAKIVFPIYEKATAK